MSQSSTPKKVSLLTATFIVSGSMIGSGIFIVSADMGRVLGSPFLLLLAWGITGVMTLIAALSYGELAGMFPKSGGQYQYLKESYGEMVAFLFGWAMFAVIQSGTIAAVAVAFAKFTGVLMPALGPENILADLGFVKLSAAQLLAIASLFVLTYLNTRGLQTGALIQNVLTTAKALSLGLLIILGLFVYNNPEVVSQNFGNFFNNLKSTESLSILTISSAIGVAMVGSLFSSDAWNNVTFIAGEIENPKRNVPLALGMGVIGVTILYMLANLAYLCVLPFWGDAAGGDVLSKGIQYAEYERVGTAALTAMLGLGGGVLMAVIIMISTFGCNNGLLLSGSRLYQSMATDGLFFDKMKDLNANGVPGFALWVQFAWCSVLCLSGKYGDLLDYVMFAVMLFYILTVVGIFILRKKRPELERPYKAFGYPYLPALYIVLAGLFTVNLLFTKPQFTVPGLVIVGLGFPIYYFLKWLQEDFEIKLEKNDIVEALKFQHEKVGWSFYSERELLENAANQRVNFVLAVFALFIGAAATVDKGIKLSIVLITGALLLYIIAKTTYRVYVRLNIVLKILYKADFNESKHPLPMIQKEIENLKGRASNPMLKIIYVVVPYGCALLMFVGFLLSFLTYQS